MTETKSGNDQGLAAETPKPAARRSAGPVCENLFAPEVFANEAAFFASGSGVVTITFTSFRFDNSVSPAAQRRVVVGRLVMPVSGAQGLAAGLYDYLKKNGLDPVPVPSGRTLVQ